MKKIKQWVVAAWMVALSLGLGACSKEDPTPMADMLIYAQRSAPISRFVDVEVDGQLVGRLTSTTNRSPDCNEQVSGSLLKTSREIGKQLVVKFNYSDGTSQLFNTMIPH